MFFVSETLNRTKRVVTGNYDPGRFSAYSSSNLLYEKNNYNKYLTAYTEKSVKWPWIVRLHFNGKRGKRCGGTLIARNIVITAAHCVKGIQ